MEAGGGTGVGQQVHQLPQHTCLGRGTSQLLSVGGSPVALLGCTEADMDFWCWRGRAAETAAEAEAVEARDPGMVRLGDKSSGEAWVRGGWGGRLGEEARAGGRGQSWERGRMQSAPGGAAGHQSELRKAELGAEGRVRTARWSRAWGGNQSAGKPRGNCLQPHWSPRNSESKAASSPERAGVAKGSLH